MCSVYTELLQLILITRQIPRYHNCGIFVLGDLNQLNDARLKSNFNLKQIVNFPTRGPNTLDKILTNLKDYYDLPTQRPAFGLSDHSSIEVQPKQRVKTSQLKQTVMSRDLRPSNRIAMRTYLEHVNVPAMISAASSCEEKITILQTIDQFGLDSVLPLKTKTVHLTEPPWISPVLKNLIKKRQRALSQGDYANFRVLRNRVNRERKVCRSKYYECRVQHLKECSPAGWWKEIKRLGGIANSSGKRDNVLKSIHFPEGTGDLTPIDLAKHINNTFLTPTDRFEPLTRNPFRDGDAPFLNEITDDGSDELPTVSELSVLRKLSALNPTKAQGPDGIPGWLLKENAALLAGPVTEIINTSYRECRLPPSWKEADVVPIPKQKPIKDVNKHLRPISLTPIISKIAEDHVVQEYVKPAVLKKIDQRQFGTIPNSCTSHALISMTHNWYVNTDGNGATARVVLFDFRKAFDLIDHNILVQKLSTYDLPKRILCWIVDFLMDRKQRVKLAQDCFSEWRSVVAGVPQGTKLGPWLYLIMINDLDTTADMWKYVDDTSISELVEKGHASNIQNVVSDLSRQSISEGFELNESKCKELRISFARRKPEFDPLVVNGKPLEIVTGVKVLGLNISSDLKWNMHIMELVKKANCRLYFLKQLKRASVAPRELTLFYITCIRSILEYACPVFHRSLPAYLSEDLERLQKRALRIIYPHIHYSRALEVLRISTLFERRETIASKLFDEITNDQQHRLHNLLPVRNMNNYSLRSTRKFVRPLCKTERCKNSFIQSYSYSL